MNLKQFIYKKGLKAKTFAELAKIHPQTIYNINNGREILLSIAYKIEIATKGEVTCQDLAEFSESQRKIK